MISLSLTWLLCATVGALVSHSAPLRSDPWVVYEGGDGPGKGRHIVLVSGDEEYRSEEALPMLGQVLARHHGFRCTVLFAIDPESGEIDPEEQTNIPGIEKVADADLIVLFTRFRELPDESMKPFVAAVEKGTPILGIRTATHAFAYRRNPESPYARYGWNDAQWPGGFGKQILGETWVAHHGAHGSQATRGRIEPEAAEHPILRGVSDVFGTTDVYAVRELPEDATVLVRGLVLDGMTPESQPLDGPKNEPAMPLVWTRELTSPGGKPMRTICSTIGASQDLACEDLRRLFVNACYWGLGMEDEIPARSTVHVVGSYAPTPFGFGAFTKGVRPADHAWPADPSGAKESKGETESTGETGAEAKGGQQ